MPLTIHTIETRLIATGIGLFVGLLTGFLVWIVALGMGAWALPLQVIGWFGVGEGILGFILPKYCYKLFGAIVNGVLGQPGDLP